ncbi:glycosyltransferase family 2 protein [Candidatus Woesearchaeota archaeon]|nr:glycosyltransferase family 2 protein [Candidatus Woesearchaeota archaeon]
MEDLVMALTGVLFFILFAFLGFIFVVFLVSRCVKRKEIDFKPKVSIVIPTFNEEKNIKECLDSIFDSDYPKEKIEVIVVDDGSKDKTTNIVNDYKKVHLLKQNHCGKSEALNLGALKASHEFILTIDADTIIDKDCIKEIVKPLADKMVGASTGNSRVKNSNSLAGIFQNIEYHYNNLIRNVFSIVFKNGIWFFGALACYRKSVLVKIGHFKKDSMTEDMDIALEIKKEGYKTINVHNAFGYTIVPKNFRELYTQRSRWWVGVLQSLIKNRDMFSHKSSPAILFLFVNQFWWSFYAFLSFPAILYQVNYWLPYNSQSFASLFGYLFRWFSLSGPIFVLYKLPVWGISFYSFFGVLSGIISTIMIVAAIKMFKDRINFKNMFAIFFYFPYTIILNIIIVISLLRPELWRKKAFIR